MNSFFALTQQPLSLLLVLIVPALPSGTCGVSYGDVFFFFFFLVDVDGEEHN